jgi:hypothetical protein
MTKWLLVAAVLAAGCKSEAERSMAELAALRDKMCACQDRSCADTVNEKVGAFFKRDRARFDSMSGAEKEQSKKLEDEQYECWKKLTGRE